MGDKIEAKKMYNKLQEMLQKENITTKHKLEIKKMMEDLQAMYDVK